MTLLPIQHQSQTMTEASRRRLTWAAHSNLGHTAYKHQQAPILHVWMSAWCALVYSSFKTQGTDDKLYCNWFYWPCRVTEVPVCLVGNKQDLCHARQVYEEEGRSVALDNKCHFQEVSASDGYQEIANLFTWLIRQVMEHLKYRSDHRRYSGSKSMSKLINNVFGKRRKSV